MAMDTSSIVHPLDMELVTGQTIRLIELLPGNPSDSIVIRLSIHELTETPDYEALSYVWGDPKERTSIECDGRILSATINLAAAFRKIRYTGPNRSRLVWADAICINQGNNREKSHHVAFMNLVYMRAKTVLIFTGEDVDGGAHDVVHIPLMSTRG